MHLKRQKIPKSWPIPRKGTKFLAKASHEKTNSIPLIVVIRDILKITKTNNELKKLINNKQILINGKEIRETNYPINLFDSIGFPLIKKYYRSVLKGKKIYFEEISEKEAESKIYKVVGKKLLKNNKIQLNLNSGKNILSSEKANINDFVILNNNDNKIVKTISLGKGSEVVVVRGKHIGAIGKIKDIQEEGENDIAELETKDGDIKVELNNLFVVKK